LSAENGELIQDINTNIVNLTEKSVIKVNATIDEVAKITRQGNSAVIYFKVIRLLSILKMVKPLRSKIILIMQ